MGVREGLWRMVGGWGIGVRKEVRGEVGSPAGGRVGGGGMGMGGAGAGAEPLDPSSRLGWRGCEIPAKQLRKACEARMAGAGRFHNYYIIQPMLH